MWLLFGDPGSNKWIAKLNGKLPVKWTRDMVSIGEKSSRPRKAFRH